MPQFEVVSFQINSVGGVGAPVVASKLRNPCLVPTKTRPNPIAGLDSVWPKPGVLHIHKNHAPIFLQLFVKLVCNAKSDSSFSL